MTEITYIPVPKESVSDDTVIVARWLVPEAARVARRAPIALLETSKAAVEVEAPADGYLFHLAAEGDRVAVGNNFAVLGGSPTRPVPVVQTTRPPAGSPDDARFSNAARQLLREQNVDPRHFAHLALVRREDVQAWLEKSRRGTGAILEDLPPAKPDEVLIWGGGGHAKVCIEILRAGGQLGIYGIVDAQLEVGSTVLGVPVVAHDSRLEEFRQRGVRQVVLGIGAVTAHASRRAMSARIETAGFGQPTIIHPSAVVDPSARLGSGNVVFANATISADVKMGNGGIVNSGVVISHDCVIGNNVHLAPGALLAGGVQVGDNTLIGMGVKIFLQSRIGANVRINNGAVVEGMVPDGKVVQR